MDLSGTGAKIPDQSRKHFRTPSLDEFEILRILNEHVEEEGDDISSRLLLFFLFCFVLYIKILFAEKKYRIFLSLFSIQTAVLKSNSEKKKV